MKIGRNDPCPCGSGKKYKKCCLTKDDALDFVYRRITQTHTELVNKLMRFVTDELEENIMDVAFEEFLLWDEDALDEYLIDDLFQIFIPWFLFSWNLEEADIEEMEENISLPANTTIAELFTNKYPDALKSKEKSFLDAVNRRPFSFYEVVDVISGRRMICEDVFTGESSNVTENSASKIINIGDIVFCSIASVDNISILVGTAPIKFPLSSKIELIDIRLQIAKRYHQITDQILNEYDSEIRSLFLEMLDRATRPPKTSNTDGEPLIFTTLHYAIDDAEEAFEALHYLDATVSREELLSEAGFDSEGKLTNIEFSWIRIEPEDRKTPLPTTVLATFMIDGAKMTVDVNSENRAKLIKDTIQKALGDKARLRTSDLKPFNPSASNYEPPSKDAIEFHEKAMQEPEVREYVENMLFDHWRRWVDAPLPALNGLTPREAVKTANGREKVDILLRNAISHQNVDNSLQIKGIEHARKELGL